MGDRLLFFSILTIPLPDTIDTSSILLKVRVPVLSTQRTDVAPNVSIA